MSIPVDLPYDVSTSLGRARFHASDTLDTDYIWSDDEVNYALSLSGNVPTSAAAYLLETLAIDQARIAYHIKIGRFSKDLTHIAEELRLSAATLRETSNWTDTPRTPDVIFTTDNTLMGVTGSMDGW